MTTYNFNVGLYGTSNNNSTLIKTFDNYSEAKQYLATGFDTADEYDEIELKTLCNDPPTNVNDPQYVLQMMNFSNT